MTFFFDLVMGCLLVLILVIVVLELQSSFFWLLVSVGLSGLRIIKKGG